MRWSQPIAALLLGWAVCAVAAHAACGLGVAGCCSADAECDDADVCNGVETCDLGSGSCLAGTPLVCAPSTCLDVACDPAHGCGSTPSSADTACPDDGDPCTGDVCDGAGACTHPPSSGASCDDGDRCTDGDVCTAGVCAGTPKTCGPIDACHTAGVCDPGTGACSAPEAPPGTSCNDGLFCNGIDTCQAGVCVHAGDPCANGPECARVCDEADDICGGNATMPCNVDPTDPCSGGQCNGEGQCVPMPMDDVVCDDHDACTVADHCHAGQCLGTPRSCAAPDDCHLDGVCDADTGVCVNPPAVDDTPCASDGRTCTVDRCRTGVCQHVPDDALCDDGTCSAGACRPADAGADAHGCVNQPVHENEACTDDGIPCTADVCHAGACAHLPADDRCDPASECGSTVCAPERGDARGCAVPPGAQDGEVCSEDADPCTDDRCAGASCTHTGVTPYETCEPVAGAWDRARALARGVLTMRAGIKVPAEVTDPLVLQLLHTLDDVAAALGTAADALAGRAPLEAPDSPIETIGQLRARTALVRLAKTPAAVGRILKLTAVARVRAAVTPERTSLLKQDTRVLKRGLRQLLIELRKLRKISKTIAR